MNIAKKTGHLFTTAYLALIFCLYPYYIEQGYKNIAEAKNRFLLYVSMAGFLMILLPAAAGMITKFITEKRQNYLIDWEKISATDLLVICYATAVFLSYAFSEYRAEALWGTEGWYIGTGLLLLLCGLYFLISRMWNKKEIILYLGVAASAGVFLLGICNRFSFYPVLFAGTQPDYLSTLGNINWFCGYLAVTAPIGIGLFMFSAGLWKRGLFAIFSVIAFMTGFCQGSTSVFLWFAALLGILFWIGLEKREWLCRFFFLIFLWGMAGQLIYLLRVIFPDRYSYETNNLCGYMTENTITLWIGLAGLGVYFLLRKEKKSAEGKGQEQPETGSREEDKKDPGRKGAGAGIKRFLILATAVFISLWIGLSVINTLWGIPLLSGNGFFIFDGNWGNGRGAAFQAGWQMFWERPFLHKLFGVGPDCFYKYAYDLPERAFMLREFFGNARLTNAHNELLTGLVNTGIIGVSLYLGIFVSFIIRSMKKGKENPIAYLFAMCAFCYLIHNSISFAQVLNLPYVFLFMGMGEGILRLSSAS